MIFNVAASLVVSTLRLPDEDEDEDEDEDDDEDDVGADVVDKDDVNADVADEDDVGAAVVNEGDGNEDDAAAVVGFGVETVELLTKF